MYLPRALPPRSHGEGGFSGIEERGKRKEICLWELIPG